MLIRMLRDAEPEIPAAPVPKPVEPPVSKSGEPEPKINPNEFHKYKRLAEAAEKDKADRKAAEDKAVDDAEKQRLANEGKFDELTKLHAADMEKAEVDWAKKLKSTETRGKASKYFDDVALDNVLSKLDGEEDIDAALATLIEDDAYKKYRIDIQQETPTPQRAATGIGIPAGSRTTPPKDDLDSRLKSDDPVIYRQALDERFAKRLNGELE